MPFLSGFGGAASIGFNISSATTGGGGGGGEQPYTGTLYYYEGADETDTTSTWATLGKWYKDANHTQAATALPSGSNAVVLLNNTSADMETWTEPASIDMTGHTLTLTAHAQTESCAAAKELRTLITGNTETTLILSGHITIFNGN